MPRKASLDRHPGWIVVPLLKADYFILDVAPWLDLQVAAIGATPGNDSCPAVWRDPSFTQELNDLSQRHAGPNLVERRWIDLSGHLGRNLVGQPIRGLANLLALADGGTEQQR
jgi:hypothetical protein